jgi:hypothetical protein
VFISTAGGWVSGGRNAVRTRKEDREDKGSGGEGSAGAGG